MAYKGWRVCYKDRSGLVAARNLENALNENSSREYQRWNDEADGGWEYEGDGREQEDFFRANSNFDELISRMSREEREAFRWWCRGGFMHGQQWRGWDNMTMGDQRNTRIYDKYLDEARLDKGVVLSRLGSAELLGVGYRANSLSQLQALEGRILPPAKGSMSFGAAGQGLKIAYVTDKNVEYKLHIPGGTVGAGMWIGDKRVNSWGPRQREFITNRDAVYRVGKTTFDKARGVYVVNIHYEGRTKHDYGRNGR